MKPYGERHSGSYDAIVLKKRARREPLRLLARDMDAEESACSCGCDDDWMSWGGAFGGMPCDDGGPDCPCCDTPRAYREPMFVTLAEVAA